MNVKKIKQSNIELVSIGATHGSGSTRDRNDSKSLPPHEGG